MGLENIHIRSSLTDKVLIHMFRNFIGSILSIATVLEAFHAIKEEHGLKNKLISVGFENIRILRAQTR